MARSFRLASRAVVLAAGLAGLGVLACSSGKSAPPAPRYFAFDGVPTFVASRNITGRDAADIEALLDKAADEGTTLVRFHVTHAFGTWSTSAGAVVEDWAASWDDIFEYAASKQIQVLPVFGVWADWNDGYPDYGFTSWSQNPFQAIASSPVGIYQGGSALQRAWLGWVGDLVTRWQVHPNVVAWEVFSELNLVSYAPGTPDWEYEAGARGLLEEGAKVIRGADALRRPVTASLSGWWNQWPTIYQSSAIDLAQVHLYGDPAYPGNLDAKILDVGRQLRGLGKPILLGESGLDFHSPDGTTWTTGSGHELAARHAVWAALVSGYMNGRALWWEDGYDLLENEHPGAEEFVFDYPAVEAGALAFVAGRDLSAMRPLAVDVGWNDGGAIGDEHLVLGWVVDGSCGYPIGTPDPYCTELDVGESVSVTVPGSARTWQAVFRSTATGEQVGEPVTLSRSGGVVVVPLPAFADDIAFELTAQP